MILTNEEDLKWAKMQWEAKQEEEEERAFYEMLNFTKDLTEYLGKKEQQNLIDNVFDGYLNLKQLDIMEGLIEMAEEGFKDLAVEYSQLDEDEEWSIMIYEASKLVVDLESLLASCNVA